jgi:two-component system, LytTR family, sensor kinase
MQLLKNKRFRFKKVFWVVLSVYVFFTVLGLIILSITPASTTNTTWDKVFSWQSLLSTVSGILFGSFFYYLMVNWYYNLWYDRNRAFDFLKPTLTAIGILAVYYTASHFLFKGTRLEMEEEDPEKKITIGLLIFSYSFMSMLYLGVAMLVAYLTTLRDEKKQRTVLEQQKIELEMEKSQANFNFLKAQINPHFLHNTLNFLYAKSLPYSPELSEGILTLSDIMRYALSEGNAKDGKAPLKDEIEHLRNVIKINQLRFSNQLNVQFDVEGVVNGYQIIPFVLITLVENAFKHGDVKSAEHPIESKLKIDNGTLYFYCRNKKKTGPKELSTGIGLDNIKKRLDLAYGNNYRFDVKEDADFYTTELTITQL